MYRFDHDALICDMAETYQIYDLRALPLRTVAVLAVGLRENSRIKTKLNGYKIPVEYIFSAMIVDRLSLLWWAKTEDGAKNKNRPAMLLESLIESKKDEETLTFDTPEEFRKAWEEKPCQT